MFPLQSVEGLLLRPMSKCQFLRFYCSNFKFYAVTACMNGLVHLMFALFLFRITDNLLAMARPSTEIIDKFDIIDQFLR